MVIGSPLDQQLFHAREHYQIQLDPQPSPEIRAKDKLFKETKYKQN